jgi:threonine dehydrogenase-like Zn-dependent dehydrogenase
MLRSAMQVATWRGETRFTLDEVPEPGPGPGEVLVAIHTAGICGSDVHAIQGLFPVTPPRVLGHEYSGRVVAVGAGVTPRLRGRPVACEPNYGCGECAACREGRDSQCARCVRVGGFAERVVLPRQRVHPLPSDLDPATAALAEPAACCLAGLETFRMPRDATVVVLGGGLMGLLTLALARARGARTALLSDPLASRRALAERLGAAVTVDPTREDLGAAVARLTGGRGADVACEAVGKPELVAEAVRLVRPRGIVQLVGVNPPGSRLPADLFDFHFRELTLLGAYGRGTAFRRALTWLAKTPAVRELITARFPLPRIADAFAHAAAGHGIKTVVGPE